jgi:hypothetical protein
MQTAPPPDPDAALILKLVSGGKNMPTSNNVPTESKQPAWTPTPAGKQQASSLRILSVVLWVLAIAGEAFIIFWVLKQPHVNMLLLIGGIILIGVLTVVADLQWKRANQLDPASTSEPLRFFIQNQLGAIISLIAFLPMIIMIFLNKNMNGQQKGIAGAVGIVVLAIAAFMGISFKPPSVEQYASTASALTAVAQSSLVAPSDQTLVPPADQTVVPATAQANLQQFPAESAAVIGYTGQDLVFWKIDSTVYHLCAQVSALQRTNSKDNTIYSGTVAQAHAAGIDRLTQEVNAELRECGYNAAPTTTP